MNRRLFRKEINEYNEDTIYHYTDMKIFIENIMRQQNLKFNKLKEMDDPYEYKKYDALLNSAYVCCFTEDCKENYPLVKGYSKSRMWSQYGGGHEGVCIAFSKEKLLENLKNVIANMNLCENEYHITGKSVIYNELLKLDEYENENYRPEVLGKEQFEKFLKYEDANIFQKNRDYKDENEFRIVILPDKEHFDNYKLFPFKDAIKYIVIGDRANGVYLQIIKKYAKINKYPIKQIHWCNGNPYCK